MYGSSRLGIKQYEPHQYRNIYSNTQPFVKGINVKQPWYSGIMDEEIKSGIKAVPLLSTHYLIDTFRPQGAYFVNTRKLPRPAQFQRGGVYTTKQYQLFEASYTTYGQYLPGVSDIVDGLDAIAKLSDGQYKAAALSAIFLIPGADFFKPLKKLKGAGVYGACESYAADFIKKFKTKFENAGATVKKNANASW